MSNMSVVYEDANDQHVCCRVLYVDTNGIACWDDAFKHKLPAEDLESAFLKRVVIKTSAGYAVPVTMTAHTTSTAYASLSYGSNGVVYSKEYSAD